MSSLLLLNGSPRGPRSNSMKLLTRLGEGWERGGGDAPTVLHLAHRADFDRAVAAFVEADTVILGMPLYTDAMPALVKEWIEAIADRAEPGHDPNPRLAFVVQSGFPEACHSRPLERYLEKLARRLDAPYAGTIVRGGGESLQAMPDEASRKLWAQLHSLGEELARDGRFSAELLSAVGRTERFSAAQILLLKAVYKLPISQFYFNSMLKKNGAWDRRFARPYDPSPVQRSRAQRLLRTP